MVECVWLSVRVRVCVVASLCECVCACDMCSSGSRRCTTNR